MVGDGAVGGLTQSGEYQFYRSGKNQRRGTGHPIGRCTNARERHRHRFQKVLKNTSAEMYWFSGTDAEFASVSHNSRLFCTECDQKHFEIARPVIDF